MRFFEHLSVFRHHQHHHEHHHERQHGNHHHHHASRHGHRGFQGFGMGGEAGFPGDLGRGGRGGHGLGPGRKLGSADLQLLILALLADKPQHGYEIIKSLDERSKGYYSPSPGMVYPALTYLEEIGHASFETEGTKKLYSITVAGLAHLDENRGVADTLLQQLSWIGQRMDHLRRAMAQDGGPGAGDEDFDPFGPANAESGDVGRRGGRGERARRGERGEHAERGERGERSERSERGSGEAHGSRYSFAPELREAYHALKYALGELRLRGSGIAADEQQRIAAILARAAAEIRGGSTGSTGSSSGGGSSGGAA